MVTTRSPSTNARILSTPSMMRTNYSVVRHGGPYLMLIWPGRSRTIEILGPPTERTPKHRYRGFGSPTGGGGCVLLLGPSQKGYQGLYCGLPSRSTVQTARGYPFSFFYMVCWSPIRPKAMQDRRCRCRYCVLRALDRAAWTLRKWIPFLVL